MQKIIRLFLMVLGLCLMRAGTVSAEPRPLSPFAVTATVESRAGEEWVHFDFKVPEDHVIYADHLHFENASGEVLSPEHLQAPVLAVDKATMAQRPMYDKAFSAEFKVAGPFPTTLLVKLQGCSNSACYFPEKHYFSVTSNSIASLPEPPAEVETVSVPAAQDWQSNLDSFTVAGRETGYLNSKDFSAFLTLAQSGKGLENDPMARYKKLGLGVTLLLILLGGIGLNLTPCVLPLIPINLAIIGAGSRARSKRHGFLLGGVYGAGMAVVYGALGLAVVLTGAKFGTLNSSVWFNVIIGLIFIALSLAMFDLVDIDFSRFQGGAGAKSGQRNQFLFAFGLGAVAALLAGACVAPVVISVLLLSTNLYAKGVVAGLLLPFLLGLGMGLPWPFAGAGLQFMPRPGKWMKWVKHGFGVLILVFAGYYLHLSYGLFQSGRTSSRLAAAPGSASSSNSSANEVLAAALKEARASGRSVFIDFHASWCKNCLAMEETVFNQPEVQKRLGDFVVVKYQAERPNESPAREVLDRFGVLGLPTYVVLTPKK